MDQLGILQYISTTFPGVDVVSPDDGPGAGDTFFIYDPDRSLDAKRRLPFATIVTKDYGDFDRASDLNRPGVFRLNIGLRQDTYRSLFGPQPSPPGANGVVSTGHDFTATDQLLPHPVYAPQSWVCVLNPGDRTFETLRSLLAEAYDIVATRHGPRPTPATGRPFRFGVVAASARSADEWIGIAQRAESLGYATLLMPENLQYTLAPLPALAMVAAATRSLRIGTYVLVNDLRSPVLLSKEAATLDLLSNGRFELGMGAGRPESAVENGMLGLPFDSGAIRVARLAESLSMIKALLAGERRSTSGAYYSATNAQVSPLPVQQPRLPILVAGSGRQLLSLAAREADIIGLGLPPDATEAAAKERIGWIRSAAGDRFSDIELNVNLMAIGEHVPRWISARLGVTAQDLAERGSVSAVSGPTEQMGEQLLQRRARLGISYVVVAAEFMDLFAPVVGRLAGG